MKIAFLGDAHWGARGNSEFFLRKQIEFHENHFFPYLLKNNIKMVIQFGDLLDQRKFINVNVMSVLREKYLKWFEDNEVNQIIIQGNHDVVHNNTNRVSALTEIVGADFPHSTVITKPVKLSYDNATIDMIPWINRENMEEISEFIEKTTSGILIGHLEINGFEMVTGITCRTGLNKAMFKRYDKVYSGHFHTQSENGNIHYIGTPYQLNWGDYGHQKGFHIFDTISKETNFIKNPDSIYHKLMYNDETVDYDNLNVLPYKDTIIKIIVEKKDNDLMFDRLISKLQVVVQDMLITDIDSFDVSGEDLEGVSAEDPLEVLLKSVDGMKIRLDKNSIKRKINSIYKEAEDLLVAE